MMTNLVSVVATGSTLPWETSMPSLQQIGAMALVGVVGGLGQRALFASSEQANATTLAPFECSGLLWAFLISTTFWGIPLDSWLMLGAAIIAASRSIGAFTATGASRKGA